MPFPLTDMFPEEIAQSLDIKPFQGKQVFRWLYQKQAVEFSAMTDLSKGLRARLAADAKPRQLEPVEERVSPRTGTTKRLFRLHDGDTVEAVLIPDQERITICVSSQAGCALQCAFCATGLAGFRRNLSSGEIAEQILHLLAGIDLHGRTPNIVYMGMGEPLRNYDHVTRSIRLLMRAEGLNIGARKITVSTAGEVKGIRRFAAEDWQVRLSVSLHAANDRLRDRLVPLNRRYPLEPLHKALEEYIQRTGRQITLEWVLLDGVNDTLDHARELLEFARGLKASVNLIPWNPVEGIGFQTAPPAHCQAFRAFLTENGLKATLRQEKGGDIGAACGQLRRLHADA